MRSRLSSQRGFGLTELVVVMAFIGVLSVLAVPNLLTYWQTSTLGAGADELAGILSRARALAVTQNTSVCVQVVGTNVRFLIPNCAGTVWTGTGTDAAGMFRLSSGLQIGGGASAIFTNTGGANPGATYSVTNPHDYSSRTVAVSTTGRVIIQ